MVFKNMKTRAKITLTFLIATLFFTAALIAGIMQISTISKKSLDVYQKNIRTLETLENFKNEFKELRRMTTVAALRAVSGDQVSLEQAISDAAKVFEALEVAGTAHMNRLIETNDSQRNIETTNAILDRVHNDYWPKIELLYAQGRNEELAPMLASISECSKIAAEIENDIDEWFAEKMSEATDNSAAISTLSQRAILVLMAAGVFSVVLSLILAFLLGSSISRRVNRLRVLARQLADGHVDISFDDTSKDELGELTRDLFIVKDAVDGVVAALRGLAAQFDEGNISKKADSSGFKGIYVSLVEEINNMFSTIVDDTLAFFNCVQEFGKGNFDADARQLPGEKAIMNESLNAIRNKLKSVVKDISELAESAANGKLSSRVDVSQYDGDWVEMLSSLNELMEVVSVPITEAETVLSEVAKGNFDKKITGDYQGDFLMIKSSVNNMIDNIEAYISEIAGTLAALADNNLNLAVKREYVGKFAVIKDALNNIIEKFNNVISDIASSSQQVAIGAKQISESSIALSEGTTEQAASVEELNATVQTINESTTKNAESAKEAESLSEHSKENAAKGDLHMKKMLASMDGIKKSSNSISKIIKVIDDIAFQTNILALNAAVEGARAGVHGKGFAVVAEEVRNLAGRSQQAAKETAQLIEESINRVNEGTQMADSTAQALQTIVGDVTKVADIITCITAASEEQATAIYQVTEGLSQITEVVQNNSSTSEEAASAAQQLHGQSEMLRKLVDIFKLKSQ